MLRCAIVFAFLSLTAFRAAPLGAQQSRQAQAAFPAAVPEAGVLAGQRANLPPYGSSANRWRYSFHHGHWWYYREGGRWSYWTGKQWQDYEPRSYAIWYGRRKMADIDAQLARFDARWMQPYLSGNYGAGGSGWTTLGYRGPSFTIPGRSLSTSGEISPWGSTSGVNSGLFTPHGFDGRLNPATSIGGYMGGALRGPSGY